MKTTDRLSGPKTEFLLRQAEDFAAASVAGVLSGLEEDPLRPNRLYRDYAQLMLGLEVHYLFPNLNGGERKVLSDLLNVRNKLVVRKGAQGGVRKPVASVKRSKEDPWQRRLKELKTRARALGRSRVLTSTQREVLDQLLAADR